jgi:hypothetical protein
MKANRRQGVAMPGQRTTRRQKDISRLLREKKKAQQDRTKPVRKKNRKD